MCVGNLVDEETRLGRVRKINWKRNRNKDVHLPEKKGKTWKWELVLVEKKAEEEEKAEKTKPLIEFRVLRQSRSKPGTI